ncbi:uncharacterized protein LOC108856236 [Raphanus sativus]|uniref:Uncharacterized protein LOC108856236 n=1 Tax=Raphanus sativus TaxID=3726 RepID=A0A6J0NL69_RAPSA|nr:uncharacterized protein LOC108856236 [Raphanus sativus]
MDVIGISGKVLLYAIGSSQTKTCSSELDCEAWKSVVCEVVIREENVLKTTVRLLRFREAINIWRGGELIEIDMLLLDAKDTLYHCRWLVTNNTETTSADSLLRGYVKVELLTIAELAKLSSQPSLGKYNLVALGKSPVSRQKMYGATYLAPSVQGNFRGVPHRLHIYSAIRLMSLVFSGIVWRSLLLTTWTKLFR